MTQRIHPGPFLRLTLLADALTSAAVGLLMATASGPIARLTGLPANLLLAAGLALLPYAAYLLWIAGLDAMPSAAVWLPIALNILWAAECAAVAFVGQAGPLGEAFLALQIMTVLAFAGLEFVGMRRAGAALR